MSGNYEVIEHSEEPVDTANALVSTVLFGGPNLYHKVVIQDRETGETATGWGDSYEEALENAIEQLE